MTSYSHSPRGGPDIRRLTTLTAVVLAFFGCVLLGVIGYAGWSANNTAAERERTLLDNSLNRAIARTLDEEKSVAWWDDSITNIVEGHINFDFVDANFGVFLTETYGHHEVYILNAQDKPIYAFFAGARQPPTAFGRRQADLAGIVAEARGMPSGKLLGRPDFFSQNQAAYQSLKGAVKVAHWSGHIIMVDGRPAIATALSIVPNVNMHLMPAKPKLVVTVRYIDGPFIADIGRALLLPNLALSSHAHYAIDGGTKLLLTDDGFVAGEFTWKSKRPGQSILGVIMPLTAAGVLVTGLLFAFMFRRLKTTAEDLADREALARYASKHDALSGLPNRAHFSDQLAASLEQAGATGSVSAVIAYIDVDRFKDINDTLGHRAGDHLIVSVGRRLGERLGEGELLARFGGDEFAVFSMAQSEVEAADLAARIAFAFDEAFELEGQLIRVTASIGLALAPRHGDSVDELMRHADIALYHAKNQGRNQAAMFTLDMAAEVEDRRAIELDLREALNTEQLRLHYQPIISCATNRIVGVEALLRWRHPVRGDIGPALFIPIAEEAGLMPVLGEWILSQAMQDSARWPDLEIAVNLSPVQILHMDLEETFRRLIKAHRIDPRRFVLEITEGVLLDANERSRKALTGVRQMGFKTSLDDFGTGYSSLAYLCNFQFDKIKVDRSFVSGSSRGETARTIVQAVATLGRGLGLSVIAEGVETEEDAIMVRHLGCTEMQGYLFSKAVGADEVQPLIDAFAAGSILANGEAPAKAAKVHAPTARRAR